VKPRLHADALDALWHATSARIFAYFVRFGVPEDHADDLVQEVFAVVMDQYHRFDGGNAHAWVFTLARYELLTYRAAQRRVAQRIDDLPLSDWDEVRDVVEGAAWDPWEVESQRAPRPTPRRRPPSRSKEQGARDEWAPPPEERPEPEELPEPTRPHDGPPAGDVSHIDRASPSTMIDRLAEVASRLLPARVSNEEIGDTLELICLRREQGEQEWRLLLALARAFSIASINSFRRAWRQWGRRRKRR
jgi:hypothetical protein